MRPGPSKQTARRRSGAPRAAPRPRTARQYHHGNLREALIEAGLELIQQKGVAALTLREIGARVGVSRMAAYRHFADRAALLAAISEAGFVRFGDSLEEARRSAPQDDKEGIPSRLQAMAVAYVRFAAAHPAHYEVMFGAAGDRHAAPSAAGARSFGILEDTIRDGQEKGVVRPGNSTDLARAVWCMVHGISTLAATGRLGREAHGPRFTSFCAGILEAGLLVKV